MVCAPPMRSSPALHCLTSPAGVIRPTVLKLSSPPRATLPTLGGQGVKQSAGLTAGGGTVYSTIPPVESFTGDAEAAEEPLGEAEAIGLPAGPEQATVRITSTTRARRIAR